MSDKACDTCALDDPVSLLTCSYRIQHVREDYGSEDCWVPVGTLWIYDEQKLRKESEVLT